MKDKQCIVIVIHRPVVSSSSMAEQREGLGHYDNLSWLEAWEYSSPLQETVYKLLLGRRHTPWMAPTWAQALFPSSI